MITCFCDSSFDEKNKICGIGIVINKGLKQRTYSVWIKASTNNYGELFGIYLAGILLGGEKGKVCTDSQTAISYINNNIKDKPRTREQYYEHQRMRVLAYKVRKLNITVEKVKAHQKHLKSSSINNNIADLLAKSARSRYYEK